MLAYTLESRGNIRSELRKFLHKYIIDCCVPKRVLLAAVTYAS